LEPTTRKVGDHFNLKKSGVVYVNYKSNPIGPDHMTMVPFCLLLVFDPSVLKKTTFWDIAKLENAILKSDLKVTEVPQLEPESPSFEELKERYDFWYKANPNMTAMLDKKIQNIVNMKKKLADKVKGISKEELDELKNPASSMLGFDLEYDKIKILLKEKKICPEAYDFDEQKNKCKKNKKNYENLILQIEKYGKIKNGEVMLKDPKPPKCNDLNGKCRKKGGVCVSEKLCNASLGGCKKKGCSDGCLCHIPNDDKCQDTKDCTDMGGSCVRRSECDTEIGSCVEACNSENSDCICQVRNSNDCPTSNKCRKNIGICVKDCPNDDASVVCEKDMCEGNDCDCKLCKQGVTGCDDEDSRRCVPNELCKKRDLDCDPQYCGNSCSCAKTNSNMM